MHINGIIVVSLRELHTSETALQDACVCMSNPTCGHMPKILIERTDSKFAHMLKLNVSLSNSTHMDLLNATVDHDRQGQAAHAQMVRYRHTTHSS